jgi:hypothetical protein
MTIFIVEHEMQGRPFFETIRGVEDIDLDSMFSNVQTLWVCDQEEEVIAVENELRRKHARRG